MNVSYLRNIRYGRNKLYSRVCVCVCVYTLTGMHGPAELLTSR